MSEKGVSADRRARAMFLLPALMTTGNIFLGFFSIVKALDGHFAIAASCLVFAGVLDKFDGFVARKTGTDSTFGKELDSLADVISFGVAPALLAFTWGLRHVPKLGWAACFLFLLCGTLRLARYNVQASSGDRRWFVGLPIPLAASIPVTLILAWSVWHPERPQLGRESPLLAWLLLTIMVAVSLLMVSTVRYFAFKDVRVGRARRNLAWLSLGLVTIAVAAWPAIALLTMSVAYVASGPIGRLLPVLGRSRGESRAVEGDAPAPPEEGGAPAVTRPAEEGP